MIDQKRRSNPSIGPLDIGKSFVDSVYNEGSTRLSKLVSSASLSGSEIPVLDKPLFQPGTSGSRTSPNEGGFAYSDTPEATIFIQKREWVEDDWTYVTNSTERLGKEEELITRIRLANIITRKLEWLNDHEVFSKFSDLTAGLTSRFASQLSSRNPTNLTLPGSQVTRFYTERFDLYPSEQEVIENTSTSEPIIPIATKVRVSTRESGASGRLIIFEDKGGKPGIRLSALHGPRTSDPSIGEISPGEVVVDTTGLGDINLPDNIIPGRFSASPTGIIPFPSDITTESGELKPEFKDSIKSAEYWKINLSTLSIEQIFPDIRDKAAQGIPSGLSRTDFKKRVLEKLKTTYKTGWIRRVLPNNPTNQLATPVQTTDLKLQLSTTTKTVRDSAGATQSINNIFNGVMELANVSSINVNINNKGEAGTASITLENPNNVLLISEEDIDIALGQNPFLDGSVDEFGNAPQDIVSTDPITGKQVKHKYYRGRYYTDRAFNLVTNQDLSAFGNVTGNVEVQALRNLEQVLQLLLSDLQSYISLGIIPPTRQIDSKEINALFYIDSTRNINTVIPVPSNVLTGGRDPHFQFNIEGGNNKIQEIMDAIRVIRIEVERSLKGEQAGQISTTENVTDRSFQYRRNQLKRFFQNRTIFQVFDRIFIWTTSPSRTVRTLQNGTVVAEEFTTGQIRAKRVQEIISLITQLNRSIQTELARQDLPIFELFKNDDLVAINFELFSDGTSSTYTTIKQTLVEQALSPTLEIIVKTIDQKIEELSNFIKSEDTQSNTKLPSPSSDSFVQGIDPKDLFNSNQGNMAFAGIADQQLQIFQGVITGVSRSYSDGKYLITLQCKDNLEFLERSRFITIPGLGQYSNQARPVLDDPIWRQKDARFTDRIISIPNDNLVGRWKTGILTLTANIESSKGFREGQVDTSQSKTESTDITNNYTGELISRAYGRSPQAENELFQGADPAQIISVLTTGYPFDVAKYIENTTFKGSIKVNPELKSGAPHSGEELRIGPFEQARQEISPLTRKYGNFEPYLDRSSQLTEEDKQKTNISTQMSLAYRIVHFIKLYIRARQGIAAFNNANAFLVSEQAKGRDSAFVVVTEDNFNQILAPVNDFPLQVVSNGQLLINLASTLRQNIEEEVANIVEASLRGVRSDKLNLLFTGAFRAEDFELAMPGSAQLFRNFVNKERLALIDIEIPIYNQIREAATSRVNRGVVFETIKEFEEFDVDLIPRPRQAPSNEKIKQIKESRDALLHPANPLQSTRESIIFKVKPNYLVISDKYIINDDLVDYVREIGNFAGSFQDNQYSTVIQRCLKAAHTIDWEFYADTQGHLRLKPPTYNRVLLKHLIDLRSVDPTYVQGIYNILESFDAIDVLKAPIFGTYKLELFDIRVRVTGLISKILAQYATYRVPIKRQFLGLESLLRSGQSIPGTLLFEVEKIITSERLRRIVAFTKASPESLIVLEQSKNKNPLSTKINELESKVGGTINTEVENILKQILEQSDVETSSPAELSSDLIVGLKEFKEVHKDLIDLNNVVNNDMQRLARASGLTEEESLASKNALITQAVSLLEAAIDLVRVSGSGIRDIDGAIAALEPELDATIESFTDTRFVHNIPSSIIISENWSENRPEYTRLNANTAFAFSGINQSSVEGQRLHWVGSVDYDLWRMYGYIPSPQIEIPFLQSGEQAVPFAHMLMARQYSKILAGSINVRGDSKYQLGDCVFIEDENLYYYIAGINHNFTYGQQYSTTLTLEYGRRPGTFIPYPFDAIGKEFTAGGNALYSMGDNFDNLTEILEAFNQHTEEFESDPEFNN